MNEFVRDEEFTDHDPPEDSGATAAKRPRLDATEDRYDDDMAEAISRSLADQGRVADDRPRSDEPQPGCSHWGMDTSNSAAEVTPATPAAAAAPSPAEPAVETMPDYQALYNQLRATNQKLISDLQSSLECPVCLETIRTAPVQCCRNGHLICNTCLSRAHICPTCRAPMGHGMAMRCVSHVANRLIDLLPHPCTNKDRGCPVEELLTVLTSHETECR